MSMKATRRRVGVTLSLGLALALATGLALAPHGGPARAAATPISSCPFTISAPGAYELTTDLSGCSDGITVTANDVQLRFNGHTLAGFQALGSAGLRTPSGVSNLLVDGLGTIQQFDNGVVVDVLHTSQVRGLVVRNNRVGGFAAANSQGNRFTGLVIRDNGDFGFIYNGPNNEVSGSTSTNNGRAGFALGQFDPIPSTGNRIHNNTATGNGETGIWVRAGATNNAITANTAQGNSSVDLRDDNVPNCVNKWSGNTFGTDNEGDGPGAGCIR